MIVYPDIVRFIKSLAPLLRKTQLVNLALLASAIILRRSLCLSELARAYTTPEKHCYRLKRLWRFLDNLKVDFSLIRQRLTILSYSIETSPGLFLPLLMDTTYFEPYAVLSISIPRGGRALPVAWDAYYHKFDKVDKTLRAESQNQREEALIASCLRQIARGIKAVLIGDRAFGRASLFSFLKERGTHFVIRVSDKVYVSHPYFGGLLHDLPLKVGQRIWLEGLLYRQDRVVKINLLAIWGIGQKEPWYLATTLSDPNLVYRFYRKRMKIEHGFRDWKYHLRLKIPQSRFVRAEHRAKMLVNAVVIAYWFICLVGIKAKVRNLKAKVASWGEISFFRLALELVSSGRLYPPWVSRVLDWVADKLLPFQPLLTYWQHQYQRRLVKSG